MMGVMAVVMVALVLYSLKPSGVFLADGDMRAFGVEDEETIMPAWLLMTMAGVAAYSYSALN